ncbi:metallophosphoesterase [Ammoniphilus sp. 3BR4]|uniref:metallophosphoesterase n=1 Tax=Ammoniphilus sp. 3BR4 TaxID=3158265 RepID=UPI003465F436
MKRMKITRRKLLTKGMKIVMGLLGMLSIPSTYTVWGERFWFKVNELTLFFPDLPDAFEGTRIVQFSDLHIDHFFDSAPLKDLMALIQQQDPDLICFTGDLMDEDGSTLAASVPPLTGLHAPLGKWAVLGNHDYRSDVLDVKEALDRSGFQLLLNQSHVFEKKGQKLALTGVDDALIGRPNLAAALEAIDPGTFTILLSHIPDYSLVTREFPIHLQLSGHSHGGQVRLPWIGPILTPNGAKHFVDGHYHVPKSSLQLYVNRGVGTTVLPIRFLCRPEVTVIVLKRGINKDSMLILAK